MVGVQVLEAIVDGQPDWMDHVHISLNGLSLEQGLSFLFELVATAEIAEPARRVRASDADSGSGASACPGTESTFSKPLLIPTLALFSIWTEERDRIRTGDSVRAYLPHSVQSFWGGRTSTNP